MPKPGGLDKPWTDVFVASIGCARSAAYRREPKGWNETAWAGRGQRRSRLFSRPSFNPVWKGRSDVFTRLFPREIVVCSSLALRGDHEWGRVDGIANGIEGFTAIMGISWDPFRGLRIRFFSFLFLSFFFPADFDTCLIRIFEYWKLEMWTKKCLEF